jgi:hypothetical protein
MLPQGNDGTLSRNDSGLLHFTAKLGRRPLLNVRFGRRSWPVWTRACRSTRFASRVSAYSVRHLVDARRRGLLQTEEARPQDIDVDVMQERRQFALSVPGDGFSYAGLRL